MTEGIAESWDKAGLPANEPSDVARVIAEIAASNDLNGKAMYVEGGRAWEIEDSINQLEPQWLSAEASRTLNEGQVILGLGDNWAKGPRR